MAEDSGGGITDILKALAPGVIATGAAGVLGGGQAAARTGISQLFGLLGNIGKTTPDEQLAELLKKLKEQKLKQQMMAEGEQQFNSTGIAASPGGLV